MSNSFNFMAEAESCCQFVRVKPFIYATPVELIFHSKISEATFLTYRENTQSFLIKCYRRVSIDHYNCVKTLWNFEKRAIDFLIPNSGVKVAKSLVKSWNWIRNLLNGPIIWVFLKTLTVADFWSLKKILKGGACF